MKKWIVTIGLLVGVLTVSYGDKEEIPTDFTAAFLSLKILEEKLAANGFEVIGKYAVAGNTNYTSVIYTSSYLKKLGAEDGRGFASIMRILHDSEAQQLVVSNPEYYIRAFYQKTYAEGAADPVLKALQSALGPLTPTEDHLPADKLAKYKFMVGMPKYDDFERVAKGDQVTLCAKLEAAAAGQIVFKLDIKGDGSSMLYGVGLPAEIELFNDKLGTMGRSQLLPYTVLIEGGEANILHAKFYLAVSFPNLSMGEFMKIRSVPGDIKDQFEAYFK
ncbi:MAG: hypothetical protein JXR25_16345 [Pontiellaceae bacterium]|nr:hypothetical protein [Pontiellaceae bacterium]MBN2786392.1 hypothetical protein [Pontiellaceae bacterium]